MDPVIICPHCKEPVLIEQINCGIFRHGILKNNGLQIDPHASKELCDYFIQNKLIYGCGRPFQMILMDGKMQVIRCDYV
jgi:hypothetical protein